MSQFRNSSLVILICTALIVTTLAVYMQVGSHQFLNFDDDVYVTKNLHVAKGITAKNISWAFTSLESCNWHPVTWISHMADVQVYGMDPRGHHLTNVAIHITSTLLLFFLLLRLTGATWQSSFVAAMFALHPLHVESVAWVAERKDVLSAFFCFLTLIFYCQYVARGRLLPYFLSIASFILGLMSKSMLVTVPIVMILIDYWPLDRFRRDGENGVIQLTRRMIPLIKEKIPFFACSIASSIITIYAQHKGGAVATLTAVSFPFRCENAMVAYVKYIGKTLWPGDLAILYPSPLNIPLWQVIGSLLFLLFLTVWGVLAAKRHPYFAVGWFWYLVTLLPVIGLIQVGGQSMADRYTYIPGIGLSIIAAWGAAELAEGLRYRRIIIAIVAGVAVILSVATAWSQLRYWRDNVTLFRHTLSITTDNYAIHNNLGSALQAEGDMDAAIEEFRTALRINPVYKNGRSNLENALLAKSDRDVAIQEYRKMIFTNPNNEVAHRNLGFALASKGELDEAIREYREALRINPNNKETLHDLERALVRKSGQTESRK